MDHDLKLGILHTYPPAWRIQMLDFSRCHLLAGEGQKNSCYK
jgi:hypothetical protein